MKKKQSLNRPVTADEIETVIKKFPTHKALDQTVSEGNSAEHLRAR